MTYTPETFSTLITTIPDFRNLPRQIYLIANSTSHPRFSPRPTSPQVPHNNALFLEQHSGWTAVEQAVVPRAKKKSTSMVSNGV